MKYKEIFNPIILANQEIKNRIFMAPMGCGFEEQYYAGKVSTEMIDYYEERAKGGTGLIISPFCAVDERYYAMTMGIYSRKMLAGISRLVEALHLYECKFLIQLSHFGGKSPKYFTHGNHPLAPSSIKSRMYPETPMELTKAQIEEIIQMFIDSAEMARDAECDGVELHGAHGYLINQFLSPHSNHRNDKYGGSLEKRMKFLDDIALGIRKKCGSDFIIGLKLSANENLENGIDTSIAKEISKRIDAAKVIDYIHVSGNTVTIPGFIDSDFPEVPPIYIGYPLISITEEIKKEVTIPVLATGGLGEPDYIENLIKNKKADAVVLGRALIADPDFTNKLMNEGNVKICIKCNTCYKRVLNLQSIKCTLNPFVGEERRYGNFKYNKADKIKKVVIIGSGPAGLEAAINASERGHSVKIFEKQNSLGGNLKLAAVPDFKQEIKKLLNYYHTELKNRPEIKIAFGVQPDITKVINENPDALVISTGSTPFIPEIEGKKNANTIQANAVYEMDNIDFKQAIIIGAGLVGSELALHLAYRNVKVKLIDCLKFEEILFDEHNVNRSMLIRLLNNSGVDIMSSTIVNKILADGILAVNSKGEKLDIRTDIVIFATGYKPDQSYKKIWEELIKLDKDLALYKVGDCNKVGKIFDAINSGAHAGWLI